MAGISWDWGMPLRTFMFFWTCSTVCSCAAAGAVGVCEGTAMPKVDSETVNGTGDDFCARTSVITRTALAQANAMTRSLRMLSFIICSDEVFPSQASKRKDSGGKEYKNCVIVFGKWSFEVQASACRWPN